MKCIKCDKDLTGRQKKFCSKRCKDIVQIADFRRNLKLRAVEYKGGCCVRCGYNKCVAALSFHHVNGKDFTISHAGHIRAWETMKQELDKCELVCMNCHMEIHAEEKWLQNGLLAQ